MMKAVIFDVDGTLVDTNNFHALCWVRALSDFGIDANLEETRSHMRKGGDQMLAAILSRDVLKKKGAEIEKHRGELFKRECLPRVCEKAPSGVSETGLLAL